MYTKVSIGANQPLAVKWTSFLVTAGFGRVAGGHQAVHEPGIYHPGAVVDEGEKGGVRAE